MDFFSISIVHIPVEAVHGPLIRGSICLLYMIKFVLVKVDMHLLSHSCAAEINEPNVIYGNTQYLVASFGSAMIWIPPSCADFNTVPVVI